MYEFLTTFNAIVVVLLACHHFRLAGSYVRAMREVNEFMTNMIEILKDCKFKDDVDDERDK